MTPFTSLCPRRIRHNPYSPDPNYRRRGCNELGWVEKVGDLEISKLRLGKGRGKGSKDVYSSGT